MRYISVVAALLFIGGCASGPVEETKAFVTAVAAVKASADTMLDDFNVAERNRFIRSRSRTGGGLGLRTADDAYYYSTIGEAPATRQFRRAIAIIYEYSELLRILVDGTNVQAVHGQVEKLAANVSALVAEPRLQLAVAALSGVIDRLAAAASVDEAKRLAIEGRPAMQRLLGSLRAAAPAILDEFLTDMQTSRAITQSELNKKVAERRVAVANYVVLLDRLDETFTRLVNAFERPSNPVTLAALIKASTDLNADVLATRKALAILRGST